MWWVAIILFSHQVAGSHNWDLLIFTQHWPSTVCLQYEESSPHHVCARPRTANSWTIHGVWPTKLGTIGPGFCDPSLKFDPKPLSPLLEELDMSWPNLEADKGDDSLWDHEWTKHGTCAVSLPALNSEEKYFQQGLSWFGAHNMTSILADSGIIPSDTEEYDIETLKEAVVRKTGVNPNIQCVLERETKKPYLFEIRICFDKNLNLADCDGTLLSRGKLLTNCPLDENIRYPVQVPPRPPPQVQGPPIDLEARKTARLLRQIVEVLIFLDWVI